MKEMIDLADENKTYYCEDCKKVMRQDQFYTSLNLEKYPNEGKLNKCKKCITRHVDNWKPETYLWILQECDVPYVPEEWYKLMQKYAQDPSKVTGMTILGRYLSKMRLDQYNKYRWADSKFLQEIENAKIEQAMKSQGYSAVEIAQTIQENNFTIPEGGYQQPVYTGPTPASQEYTPSAEESFDIDLTDEEKTYLRLKWGKTYKPEEWVKLEQLYNEMMESYDIQSAGHIDTLKLICKTSLKANQLIDLGDVEGFQKMSKVYDQLMKSGRFTAAQNKAETGEFVDSISELVAICEKEGFIPRYYTDQPNDRVDETIKDLKNYTRTLVTEEMNLGNLIENAIKTMAREEAKEEDEDIEEELTLDEIDPLKDEDFVEYSNFIDGESEEDGSNISSEVN